MAAERFNNFQRVIQILVTATNFMTDECNKFYFYVQNIVMA
jgi:hypothetical protein